MSQGEYEEGKYKKVTCRMLPRFKRKSMVGSKTRGKRSSKDDSKSNLKKKLVVKKTNKIVKKINPDGSSSAIGGKKKMGLAERLESLESARPKNLPPLAETVDKIVFKRSVSGAIKDAPRLIHRTILHKGANGSRETIDFRDMQLPESLETTYKPVWLLWQLMIHLVQYHEKSSTAKKQISAMEKVYKEFLKNGQTGTKDFTVEKLLEAQGGDETKTALTLKCFAQGVAISGLTVIKSQVCPLATKDVAAEDGWLVYITLADFVQVKHVRRDQSWDGDRNPEERWEFRFNVVLTFDKKMAITAVNCKIVELTLGDEIDPELKEYLVTQFGNGDLQVC